MSDVHRYLGIPYAAAPVGPLRFRPPQPIDIVPKPRAPAAFGPAAPQPTTGPLLDAVPGMRVGGTSEDCLTLNVWAPVDADGLPVLFWVHGGAYVIGSSSLPTYDGARLAAANDVVVVSVNYRLGALGSLLLPDSANRGLLDQLAALRWVQEHIAELGGDPDAVTVFGESAGAGALLHQLAVPAARGLFRRAILQSPGGEVVERAAAESLTEAFLRRCDCGVAELGDVPIEVLLAAQDGAAQDMAHAFGSMPWAPVVDGEVLPDDPRALVAAGASAGVDVVIGTTASELGLFTQDMVGWPADTIAKVLRHLVTPIVGRNPGLPACERLVEAYGGDVTAVLSDAAMVVPAQRFADRLARHNPRTYTYVFDWPVPRLGPCHASDLPFTFGTFAVEGWTEFVGADDGAEQLAAAIGASWAAFARTGDPSNERVGTWPAHDPGAPRTMVLGRACGVADHPLVPNRHRHDELYQEGEA